MTGPDAGGVFACASGVFAHTLLGVHDGRESWTVMVGRERSPTEQLLVSLHEKKHHELHTSSPWGLYMMTAGGPTPSDTLVSRLGEGCRQTHELFATYFSVGEDGDFMDLLVGNPTYLGYYKRARQLGGTGPVVSHRLIDALLRSAMAGAELLELSGRDILDLGSSEIRERWMPDSRLRAIEDVISGLPLPSDLDDLDTDPDGLVSYRDAVSEILTGAGIATMDFDQQRRWTQQVVAELEASEVADGFRFSVELVEPEDRLASDLDDLGRERLQLHPTRLPVELVSPDDLRERATDFARTHAELGVHSLLIWLRRDLVTRQFDLAPAGDVDTTRPLLGLLSCDRVNGEPVARICAFDHVTPAVLWAATSASHRLLFFTTLATIVDTPADEAFEGIAPVFALIDQPIMAFVQHTLDQGACLRWRVIGIEGDRDLALFIFENTEIADVFYLSFTTVATRHHLGRWLTGLADRGCIQDETVAADHEAAVGALVEHIVGTFWRLDQFGGRPGR